jgi:hypothetical protein
MTEQVQTQVPVKKIRKGRSDKGKKRGSYKTKKEAKVGE